MMTARRNRLFAIGAISIAAIAFVVIAAGNIGKNLVYYWTPTDLRAAGDKAIGATIRLGGLVAANSIVRGAGASTLEFDVTDEKNRVHVKATSVPPQLFREGIGVVVEGTMSPAGHFECTRLMVSHDNQYRAPKSGEKVDAKELIETTKGIE